MKALIPTLLMIALLGAVTCQGPNLFLKESPDTALKRQSKIVKGYVISGVQVKVELTLDSWRWTGAEERSALLSSLFPYGIRRYGIRKVGVEVDGRNVATIEILRSGAELMKFVVQVEKRLEFGAPTR